MFMKVCRFIILATFILTLPGCFGGYSDDVGLEVADVVFLDDDYEAEIAVEKGEAFGVDVPYPVDGVYVLTGASFDPALFRMERYLEYEDGGEPRVRYLFTGLADGAGDVNVKMRPAAGGPEDVYRTVRVLVGGSSGILF
ncbi:hypothetical protein JCM14722_05700 [Pseudodesulfovibrio portus]|uniref:Lipoprotein n=1 Tax=Pseudodesulfovibrio portus TaxID=231439 RepID=A0ABN6RTQ6_9BACT|nr:hypothetical protein JCM14722_05700 [Pseudodesulfovibrio portus]